MSGITSNAYQTIEFLPVGKITKTLERHPVRYRRSLTVNKLCPVFHFGLKYYWDSYRKVRECHETAQWYLRLLSYFQTTCFMHIYWIILRGHEGVSGDTQNLWKLGQRSWFSPCCYLAINLACHCSHMMDTYTHCRMCDDLFEWQSSTSDKSVGKLSKIHGYA